MSSSKIENDESALKATDRNLKGKLENKTTFRNTRVNEKVIEACQGFLPNIGLPYTWRKNPYFAGSDKTRVFVQTLIKQKL